MVYGEAKLFVGQLHFGATEEDMIELFSFYGDVVHTNVLRDKMNRSTGCAFVVYGCTDEADAAILALHGQYCMEKDRPLQVAYCKKTQVISEFGQNHAQEIHYRNPRSNPAPWTVGAAVPAGAASAEGTISSLSSSRSTPPSPPAPPQYAPPRRVVYFPARPESPSPLGATLT
jgi:RNA recognition motif-containing protein